MAAEHARCHPCSFLCLDCGHGWDGTYDIDMTVDEHGRISPVYHLDGREFPRCPTCKSLEIRTVRRGRISSAHPRMP
ncbi:hypothetical protein AV521_34775 [Streptomyces sp. IMTB 2501]|nr:hypothetical protein AV521_34775 [Streptomyces sp. IMTB 2501]